MSRSNTGIRRFLDRLTISHPSPPGVSDVLIKRVATLDFADANQAI